MTEHDLNAGDLNTGGLHVDESTLILGIETSCDETAAALVMGGYDVVSSVVSTQVDLHADFGGVAPEIASRAHLDVLNPVIARSIVEAGVEDSRIDAVACTVGPGLIGALLVAPPDTERDDVRGLLPSWAPIPLDRLPFPSVLVASTDDPYGGFDRAQEFAAAWGSRFVDLGAAGHINAETGLGDWAEGLGLLATELQLKVGL